jgi:rod shape-determining protein MreC
MESVLGRYRNLIFLVGVLFLQVLGLAMQVKRGTGNNEEKDTRLIRIWAVGAVSPFERGIVWIENSTGNVWHNYFYLRGVRAENRQLKEQIEQMRLEQVRLSDDAAQARRLQTLLAFKEQYIAKTVAAQVIGSSGSDLSRVIYIDKGENSGIKRDMAVITSDGVVGKVLLVYPNEAQVLLISDQSSGVGAILEKSRLQGVIRGTASGEVNLERVMSDEQVQPGEAVLTSGGDRIFPKGLAVGTVSKVGSGKDLFLNIKVRPAADLSKLEEVLVLVEKQEREATADDHVRIRAADILAQRLPSVPDKPPVNAATGATGASATPAPTTGPAAGSASTKVNATTAPGTKSTNSVATPQATKKPVTATSRPGLGQAGSGQPGSGAPGASVAPVRTTKQKALNSALTQATPEGVQGQPAIVEQKPAASTTPQTNPPPPTEDNSPQ